jgi:hypothetical protein
VSEADYFRASEVKPVGTSNGAWALGLAVVGCCLVGNIVSTLLALDVLRDDRRARHQDRTAVGLSLAALAVNAITVGVLALVVYAAAFLDLNEDSYDQARVALPAANADPSVVQDPHLLAVGECLALPALRGHDDQPDRRVSCSSSHDGEVIFRFRLPDGAYPGDDAVSERASARCGGRPFADYYGAPLPGSGLETVFYRPRHGSWQAGDREVVCAIYDPSGERIGSIHGLGAPDA